MIKRVNEYSKVELLCCRFPCRELVSSFYYLSCGADLAIQDVSSANKYSRRVIERNKLYGWT